MSLGLCNSLGGGRRRRREAFVLSGKECVFPQSASLARGSATEALEEPQTKFLLRDQAPLPTASPTGHWPGGNATLSSVDPVLCSLLSLKP